MGAAPPLQMFSRSLPSKTLRLPSLQRESRSKMSQKKKKKQQSEPCWNCPATLLMGRKRRNRGRCEAAVARLIAAGSGERPRLAGLGCVEPRVQPSHPGEEPGELEARGELGYPVSERALYSQLTHEGKVCTSGFCRHAFPTTDNGCVGYRQLKIK